MEGMIATDRGREIARAWPATAEYLASLLPDTVRPWEWLPAAERMLRGPDLASVSVATGIEGLSAAAELGLPLTQLRLTPDGAGRLYAVPTPDGLMTLLRRAESFDHATLTHILPTDDFRIHHAADGSIEEVTHNRASVIGAGPNAPDDQWTAVLARCGDHYRRHLRVRVVVSRAEAIELAAAHLRLPAPDTALNAARYCAMARLIEGVSPHLCAEWGPVTRLHAALALVWREA